MIKVMCNASPIIGLSTLGMLNLLYKMFDVYITEEVYNEIVSGKTEDAIGKKEIEKAINLGQIKIYKVKDHNLVNKLYGHLHKGEIETIIGAKELDLNYVIIDEKSARSLAKNFFLKPIGVLGVLQRAKELNLVEEIKPCIDILRNSGFRISEKLYEDLLKKLGE